MKRGVLVTGGAGYIGSHTAVELIEAGYDVIIVDNFSNSDSNSLEGIRKITGVEPKFVEADCCDKEDEHTGIMPLSSRISNRAALSRPYFSRSHFIRVYTMKNISDTSSARLDPIAAPVMPRAGQPNFPKISIQLNTMLEKTMTTEFSVTRQKCSEYFTSFWW